MRFSIITPFHFGAEYLKDCLKCLAMQRAQGEPYRDFELILVKDRVTEDISELVGSFEKEYSITVLESDPEFPGPSAARNVGIKAAKGERLFFLDSDDYILPDALYELSARSSERVHGKVIYSTLSYDRFVRVLARKTEEGLDVSAGLCEGMNFLGEDGRPETLGTSFLTETVRKYNVEFDPLQYFYSRRAFAYIMLEKSASSEYAEGAVYVKRSHDEQSSFPAVSDEVSDDRFDHNINAYLYARSKMTAASEASKLLNDSFVKYCCNSFSRSYMKAKAPLWTVTRLGIVNSILGTLSEEYLGTLTGRTYKLLAALMAGDQAKVRKQRKKWKASGEGEISR